jgi:frataxin-like iron-binding protein CyaY
VGLHDNSYYIKLDSFGYYLNAGIKYQSGLVANRHAKAREIWMNERKYVGIE